MRDGTPQESWWNYSFTPIRDDHGIVVGILNQCNETTTLVLAERARLVEIARLRELFAQAPGAVALLHGSDYRFEFAAYRELVGHRDVIGKLVAHALPETVPQGFMELLDRISRSGEPYRSRETAIQLQRARRVASRSRCCSPM